LLSYENSLPPRKNYEAVITLDKVGMSAAGPVRRRARKIDERRRTSAVRWSEAIERNEAYEPFSAAC
jgi:hypothetical protein